MLPGLVSDLCRDLIGCVRYLFMILRILPLSSIFSSFQFGRIARHVYRQPHVATRPIYNIVLLSCNYNTDMVFFFRSLDLASHTRLLLYNRPKHPRLYRWLTLYPLYVLAEIAIIATDLAELIGSAIALCLLFPKLELWHGVLLTTADVLFILALGDPLRGKPARMFEFLIAAMVLDFLISFSSRRLMSSQVLAVLICMTIIISRVDVDWGQAFLGYVPSKYVFGSGSLYTCKSKEFLAYTQRDIYSSS